MLEHLYIQDPKAILAFQESNNIVNPMLLFLELLLIVIFSFFDAQLIEVSQFTKISEAD